MWSEGGPTFSRAQLGGILRFRFSRGSIFLFFRPFFVCFPIFASILFPLSLYWFRPSVFFLCFSSLFSSYYKFLSVPSPFLWFLCFSQVSIYVQVSALFLFFLLMLLSLTLNCTCPRMCFHDYLLFFLY